MWKLSEIDPSSVYVIQLCHDSNGVRDLRLRRLGEDGPHPDAVFETEVVAFRLLRQRNLAQIAEYVKLAGGREYGFDSHGIWFTREELDAIIENRGDLDNVPWSTATPPKLAPR